MSEEFSEISDYIRELSRIYKTGVATEMTYRTALEVLFVKMTGLTVTHERKRIECGAPDYVVSRADVPVGYIEAKIIDEDLSAKRHREQFERYKKSLNNLIITDYLTFQFFENGEQVNTVTIGYTESKGVAGQARNDGVREINENFGTFATLVKSFVGFDGVSVRNSEELSKIMASKAQMLGGIIESALSGKGKGDNNTLDLQLSSFRQLLLPNITKKVFSDIYAQ